MPPVILAVCSWLVGAFAATGATAGPLRVWSTACAGLGGLLGATGGTLRGWRERVLVASSCAALSLAGLWAGVAATHRDDACLARVQDQLRRDRAVAVVLDEPVHPSAISRGMVRLDEPGGPCEVPVLVTVRGGQLPAGVWGHLRGMPSRRGKSLVVRGDVDLAQPIRQDWRRMARHRVAVQIDRYFGRHAPVVRALVIADQDGIAPAVREQFATAGMIHLLSISGLHVAIIAEALLTLALACRLPRTMAFLATTGAVIGYVVLLGAPPPAVRSAVMLMVVGASERRQRPVHPWTALTLGAMWPAVDPRVVTDLGWQLSVSGMAALVAAKALWRRLRAGDLTRLRGRRRRAALWLQRVSGWRRTLLREVLAGVVAMLVTAPLIAWTFGRLSLVGVVSNLVAGPLMAVLQPALFLAVLLSPWPLLADGVASAAILPLGLLERVAAWAAAVPYAALSVAPTAATAFSAGIASAAWVRATAVQRWRPSALLGGAALSFAVWAPVLQGGSGEAELHMIDVGQGDAIAVRTPRGRWILIDAGRRWDGGDAGRRTVIPYIQRLGGPVAAFVMTHPHDDHIGGAASVVAALHPAALLESGLLAGGDAYAQVLRVARQSHVSWHRVHPGESWTLDGVHLQVLAPDSTWMRAQVDANETSVVLRVSYGQTTWLLMGDAEGGEEAWLLAHVPPELLRADVLKVGHHGSRTSSSAMLLDMVRPKIGLISVGADNRYGHPAPLVLTALAERDIMTLRTDRDGPVRIRSNGRTQIIDAGTRRWTLP